MSIMFNSENRFTDNADRIILAIDFDGCITQHDAYPGIAPIRPFARQVINILYSLGFRIVIWTCRDAGDIDGIKQFLHNNSIMYDSINQSIQFAPFEYESRKIYAHMYIDDKGLFWEDKQDIWIDILSAIYNRFAQNPDRLIDLNLCRMALRKCFSSAEIRRICTDAISIRRKSS